MIRLGISVTAAALAIGLAGPASAQLAGNYNGSSADGQGLTFTVGTDSGTGAQAITSAVVFFNAPCKGSTYVLNTGWGYGMTADIADRKVSNDTSGGYFDIAFSLKFSADGQTATGTISSISPTLDPSSTPPKKALYCESKKQSLTLSYAGSTVRSPAGHSAYLYDRKGRIIGQVQR